MSSNPPPDVPPPPPPAAPVEAGLPSEIKSEDKTVAMLCHLLGILTFLGPLIIWLIKKDQSKFVNEQGKEALNFQITLLIGDVIGIATACVMVGFVIIGVVWLVRLVFCIMGGIAANNGEHYRYPFSIRLIK